MQDKTKQTMLEQLGIMLDETKEYHQRLAAYEYLLEDCEEIVPDMIKKSYEKQDGEGAKMLIEVLAGYKGHKEIFLALVSWLYRGEDVALFARLIGGYGDESGIEVLQRFCKEYEPNYNEYMEIRNAVEELGGDFDYKQDFDDDPFYRYLKGLDEPEEDSRKSPFEGFFDDDEDDCDDDCHCDDDCEDDCHCHHDCEDDCDCDDEDCHCHHHDED